MKKKSFPDFPCSHCTWPLLNYGRSMALSFHQLTLEACEIGGLR